MNITTDSFIGSWEGAHENGLSSFKIDLRKEKDSVTGVWIINSIAGNEVKRAMEIAITAPRFEEDKMLFNPNPAGPPMALELINENEAFFGPSIDQSYIDEHFDEIAAANKKMFGVETPREMLNVQNLEFIQSIKGHTIKLVRQTAGN
jgi:hypothetical protein